MVSMVPRWGAWGFLKWLNGQSIVGSASGPQRLPAHVAIRSAARYVNASRDARGWGPPRNDSFEPDRFSRDSSAWLCLALARGAGCLGRGIAVRELKRLHRRTVPEGLHPAARRARADSDRRQPGPGADRDGHAVDGGHPERRGVLLHLAARRAQGDVHEPAGGRPARHRDLFRQEPAGGPARQLRAAGRQDLRLHQPHHADLRPGTQLPRAAVQAAEFPLAAAIIVIVGRVSERVARTRARCVTRRSWPGARWITLAPSVV